MKIRNSSHMSTAPCPTSIGDCRDRRKRSRRAGAGAEERLALLQHGAAERPKRNAALEA
jgi:hypothetical protein